MRSSPHGSVVIHFPKTSQVKVYPDKNRQTASGLSAFVVSEAKTKRNVGKDQPTFQVGWHLSTKSIYPQAPGTRAAKS
jgi:hypothetical protein